MKILFFVFCMFSTNVLAHENLLLEQKPLYEFGAGGGFFETPFYQGSDQSQRRSLGLPFFIYRGRILKSDGDGGTRAEFYKEKDFRFDLSFSGGFSADSKDIQVRQGMPDLDWMGAVGPRLTWSLFRSKKMGEVKFQLPLRAVYATDFKTTQDQGFLFHPNLSYNIDEVFFHWLDLFIRTGTIWSDERYAKYYYEVPIKYASVVRPTYVAKAGLVESHLDIAAAIRLNSRWRLFLGFEYSRFDGVANKQSPLLTAKDTVSLGLGIVWTIYESEERSGRWY